MRLGGHSPAQVNSAIVSPGPGLGQKITASINISPPNQTVPALPYETVQDAHPPTVGPTSVPIPPISNVPVRRIEADSNDISGRDSYTPWETRAEAKDIKNGLEADPKNPYFNRFAGVQHAWNGDHAGAMPFFKEAIDGGLEDPKTLTFAALSALNTGDARLAARWSRQAMDADPGGPLAAQAGAINKLAVKRLASGPPLKEERTPPAEEAPLKRMTSAPGSAILDSTKALVQSGREALRVHDYAKAADLAGRGLAQDPDDVAARYLRAAAYLRMRRYKEADDDARRGLELAPNYFPLMLARALAAARLGRFDEARALAMEVLRADPGNTAAARILALAAAGQGDRAAMASALERAGARNLLRRASRLPSGADATLLFSDAFLLGDERDSALPPQERRVPKWLIVLGVSALSAVLAAGLVLLLGRRDRDDASAAAQLSSPGPRSAVAPATDLIGPFRRLGTLGAGGMGVVYKAEDTSLERLVALKRMRDEIAADPRERERFLKEARIVSALDHPGIVRIHSIHEGLEGTFLVFEYVEGKTLSEAIGERGRFSLPEARVVLAQCADAVAYAHSKGVVHRDLKPSNIMLDGQGRVRVMDFGVARAAKDALTRLTVQGTVAGTPPYMSPEQEEGFTSPSCDVYALGVCLYEMLTGRLPYQASGAALVIAKHAGKVPALAELLGPDAPPGIDEVLAKALAPDPAKRFASPSDFVAALGAVPV